VFTEAGCASCHVPNMGGIAGVYSDFLLHRLEDPAQRSSYGHLETPEAPLPFEHPRPDEWKTPPLWGVADSAPYFHDGQAATLEEAIARHEGNNGGVLALHNKLSSVDRTALISFLKTLKAPHEAEPVRRATQSVASAR
jgi:CxxC motif-containing protein (DUF1111 family)